VPEAVFSSTGFRLRAAQGPAADQESADHTLADHGFADSGFVDSGLADSGLANSGFADFARRAAASLFFTFFPADCRICGSPLIEVSRLPVCEGCLIALRPLQGSYCSVCGEALHVPGGVGAGESRCPLCQRIDPPFERAVAYGSYDGGLRDLIHLLKFQQVRPAAAVLGRMVSETITDLEKGMPVGTIAVVPVPLYKRKQAQRGFNQAEMIARSALKQLLHSARSSKRRRAKRRPAETRAAKTRPAESRPAKRFELCTAILLRRRETGSQIGLTRHQRRENLRGAFKVSDPTRILNRDILLIDDVFTTGTTASECARVLLRAGAARVWVATVARTLKIFDGISLAGEEFSEEFSVNRPSSTEN
jgi:predicted amidophosphoribosyltransferase